METFEKDVIRVGKFYVPRADRWLDVTTERIEKWVATGKQMLSRGMPVNMTVDHRQGAKGVVGSIVDFLRDGDVFKIRCQFADQAGVELARKCPYVSLELDEDFVDDQNTFYPEAISAVTITDNPVVPNQKPFRKIEASRTSKRNHLFLSADIEGRDAATRSPTRNQAMNELAQIAQLLQVPAEGEPAAVCAAIMEKIKQLTGAGEAAGTELNALKLSLKKITEERDASKLELSRKAAPELDEDAAELMTSATKTELNSRVEKGFLTPAARDVALSVMTGTGKGIFLSRKSATHAGLSEPIRESILKIIDANDPKKLAELSGTRTGIQLSRTSPDDQEPAGETEARKKRMLESAKNR